MTDLALQRLAQERKDFRRDRPFGFSAKPKTREDGSVDLLTWTAIIPGKEGTYCEGGKFPLRLEFPKDFPSRPPAVFLPAGFTHINVFDNGGICLSILKTDIPGHLTAEAVSKERQVDAWRPSISLKQVLFAVQELLHTPFFGSVANPKAYELYRKGLATYERAMRAQTQKYLRDPEE